MKKKYSLTLSKEFIQYCELNDIDKIEELAHDVFERGYTILKFGETPSIARGKDVIKEVEKVVEVEDTKKIEELSQKVDKLETELSKKPKTITKEVIVEKIVEVIKEVPVKSDTEVVTKEVIKAIIRKRHLIYQVIDGFYERNRLYAHVGLKRLESILDFRDLLLREAVFSAARVRGLEDTALAQHNQVSRKYPN